MDSFHGFLSLHFLFVVVDFPLANSAHMTLSATIAIVMINYLCALGIFPRSAALRLISDALEFGRLIENEPGSPKIVTQLEQLDKGIHQMKKDYKL